MNLLIDGHNLIGQIPGISLADPDDEAKLVMLLRKYAARRRGRQLVVVFDHGVYGHPQQLDGYGVVCYFARSPQDADAQLIRRIARLSRPREWALVTADRAVARAALDRGMRVIDARAFAAQLASAPDRAKAEPPHEKADIRMSGAELREWMRLFGEEIEEDLDGSP
jgi:predicted RNA-binding protein with PIN domain